MIASERDLYILGRIHEKGVVNIKEIVRELDISETTVRRDFEKLEKQGKLKRVQGGATLNSDARFDEDNAQLTMREKKFINLHEKQIVAKAAAALVQDGESIFIDCGTSLVPLAEILLARRVKIVTVNTLLMNLSRSPAAGIFLSGGQYQPHYNMLYGPIAKEFLERFNFDHAFISCFGISLEQNKAYTLEGDSMQMKLIAMEHGKQKHLLLDASKLTRGGFYAFTDLACFDTVFCDRPSENFPSGEIPPNFHLLEND
jgi:DeoR/GlpR family transcriptional regulator of sugar metabolism